MTVNKRVFDLLVAIILGVFLLPIMAITSFLVLLLDGRPVFYISERMKTTDQGFALIKFRTMKPVESDTGVSGGEKQDRITKTGGFLRKTRLDEIPQIWNVLRGDISFVGPRPPLRQYVERFPEVYGDVLKSRPGITGMASIYFHACEERVLSRTNDSVETDLVYSKFCIPWKARLDLIYQSNRSICFDMRLMAATIFRVFR